jgi:CDP-glucose 4,6-dehydratase
MVEPEIVFHLAAQPIVAQSYADPLDSFSVNAIGTANVLECLRIAKHLVSAVIVTSDKAYENVEWDYGYRETDRLGGHDPYSASKACAEIIFSSYYRSFLAHAGVKVATARAGNVIGGGDFAADRVVPDTFRAWLHDQTAILRKPASTRPWQHVLEPLSGYLVLATELQRLPKLAGESFNFGPDSSVVQSVDELVRALSKHWKGAKVDSGVEPTRFAFHEAGLLKLCCDKALKKLHWHSILTFQESADFTADWFNRVYKQKQDPTATTSDQIDQYCALAAKRNISWANN